MMDAIPGTYSTDAPSRFTLLHPLCGGAYNLPMRRLTGFVLLLSVALIASPQAQVRPAWLDPYRENADKLIKAATGDQFAWDRVAELTDTYGQRISGSENLNRAIAWAADTMKKDGLENVHTERVMVPKWVRGAESLEITNPPHHVVPMLGLGGSVATPPAGLEAEVMVVAGGDELTRRAAEARGKIVLFNVPYTNYGETVAYRSGGARMAAPHGAVAALVRAVGPTGLRTPHTGGMNYGSTSPFTTPRPTPSIASTRRKSRRPPRRLPR